MFSDWFDSECLFTLTLFTHFMFGSSIEGVFCCFVSFEEAFEKTVPLFRTGITAMLFLFDIRLNLVIFVETVSSPVDCLGPSSV